MSEQIVDLDTYRQAAQAPEMTGDFPALMLDAEQDAVALHLDGVVMFLTETSGRILTPEDAVRLGVELIQAANLWTVLDKERSK